MSSCRRALISFVCYKRARHKKDRTRSQCSLFFNHLSGVRAVSSSAQYCPNENNVPAPTFQLVAWIEGPSTRAQITIHPCSRYASPLAVRPTAVVLTNYPNPHLVCSAQVDESYSSMPPLVPFELQELIHKFLWTTRTPREENITALVTESQHFHHVNILMEQLNKSPHLVKIPKTFSNRAYAYVISPHDDVTRIHCLIKIVHLTFF